MIANANSTVDSYQSNVGPYGGSNIRSKATVQAASSIIVNGGVLSGTANPNSPAHLGVIAVPAGATNLPLGSANPGNVNINIAADSITVSPGTYVVADLNVNFSGAINVSPAGQVSIFVTGNLNLGGNENAGGAPRNLQFLVTSSGTVNVNSQGTLAGLIYAPSSTVNLNSTVLGSVVGSSVTLNSGSAVHFDESSICPTVAVQPPTPLPRLPPGPRGCYVRTADGWQPDTCATAEFIDTHFRRPDVANALSSNAFIDSGINQHVPYVYGQFQAFLPAVGTETDTFVNRADDVCPTTRDDTTCRVLTDAPRWSFQGNTNFFTFPGSDMKTHSAAVQFVLQSNGTDNAICVWNIDSTAQDYTHKQCYTPRPKQRSGGLQPFDWGNVAGYIEEGTGDLVIVAAMSWVDPKEPYQFAVRTADFYGLKDKWFAFDGNLLGLGCCTDARFTDTTMVARLAVSSCPNDTAADSDISACPAPDLQPHVSLNHTTGTKETNNLVQLLAPEVTYPNAQLAVASWTSTTAAGTCVDPKHVFVRDYDGDTGGKPSNLNNQAFWESPDIFLVAAGTPVDVNASVTQSLVTPGASFDVYVRVHNDFGCADVTGAKALIYLADPSALSTEWKPITDGNYLGDRAAPDGDTVVPGGQALIGPFTFTAPADGLGDGHKCLIAAIVAKDEPPVSDNFDAPNSNQVAQRNVEFGSTCTYPLTNATSADGNVEIALRVIPPERPPSLAGTPDIEVSFDDPDARWFGVWNAQTGKGTDFTVRNAGGKTTVRLGKPSISLGSVVLHAGESRVAVGTLSLPENTPQSTLNIQATLTGSAGTAVVTNGASCSASGPVVR